MAFDDKGRAAPARRVAVVGSGVAGLSAAWLLSRTCEVVLYEKQGRLGGHANTVMVDTRDGPTPVDAGFIVFNEPAYPNLTALFDRFGVTTEESCMSFAASALGGKVEYSGRSLSAVFADRRNIASPRFLRMLYDIARFHRDARRLLASNALGDESLEEFVVQRGYGVYFSECFLKPMASAIWSTPASRVLDFSAAAFIKFYDNHGLLQVLDLPVWRTVRGGSQAYVEKLAADYRGRARLNTGVAEVRRDGGGVEIVDTRGARDVFDAAVLACHADETLAILQDADPVEREILGAFRYHPNHAVMHRDARQMPARRRAWSSWNYIDHGEGFAATYWMNSLQNLACEDIFLTLNPKEEIPYREIIARFDYHHPLFDVASEAARKRLWGLQGRRGAWFAGAYFGQGFHEDGLQAGLAVAEALGRVRRPWRVEHESARIHLGAEQAYSL